MYGTPFLALPSASFMSAVGTEIIVNVPSGFQLLLQGEGFNAWRINPHLVPVADAAFSIGNYTERIHNLYIGGNFKGSREVNLTAGVATDVYEIVIAAGERCGGILHYSIYASDGTDLQLFTSSCRFSAVNKAGTVTVALSPAAPDQTNDGNAGIVTAGTFAYAVTAAGTATPGVVFRINAVSSLVETALKAEVRIDMLRPQLTSPE